MPPPQAQMPPPQAGTAPSSGGGRVTLVVLGLLNLVGLALGGTTLMLIGWLVAAREPTGLFAFSMLVYAPLQLLLFIATLIATIVALARGNMVRWYAATAAVSLLALVVDIVGFVLAVWH